MKKIFLIGGITITFLFLGCGNSSNNSKSENYPITKYIGNLWGYKWYKTLAFYKGDERYKNNEVNLSSNFIYLKAYKKDNKDSRAAVSTVFSKKVKNFNVKVNLLTDGKYSRFQVLAISKKDINVSSSIEDINNTSKLTFIAGLSIKNNGIIYWYNFYDPKTNKDFTKNVGYKNYNYDLTNLNSNGSDILIKLISNDKNITYKVYDISNNTLIFRKTLNISDINITNFKGFNIVSLRSRVNDKTANENGEEAIEVSENIVNYFDSNLTN